MARNSDDNTESDRAGLTNFPAVLDGRPSWWKNFYRKLRYNKDDHYSIPRWEAYRNRGLLILVVIAIFGVIAALVWLALVSVLIHRLAPKPISNGLNNIVTNWHNPNDSMSLLSPWPDDFSRAIVPVPLHSHNDENRGVPLWEALAAGCMSVEADIWLEDNRTGSPDILVGHNKAPLVNSTANPRTLRSLYLDPLQTILENNNLNGSATPVGVYDASPNTTLVLLLDFKSNGTETWPIIMQLLEPLRQRGWLTSWDSSTNSVTERPIRVVGSGNTPFSSVVSNSTYRDIFFDAPLEDVTNPQYNTSNSYTASVSMASAVGYMWFGKFSSSQLKIVQTQIKQAKDKGLVPRYWETVAWPISWRNYIWNTLVDNEVGLLNVDDVKEASRWDWNWCTIGGLVLCGY